MPPKKGGRGTKTPTLPPLDGCTIALSGNFPGRSQSALEQEFINVLGASLAKTVTASTTHLVTTEPDFAKPSAKVKQAKSHDVHIVKLAWLEDCLDQATRLSEDSYSFDPPASATPPPAVAAHGKASNSRKRTATTTGDDVEDDKAQPQLKKKAKATSTNGSQSQAPPKSASSSGIKSEPKTNAESKLKIEVADGNIAKSSDINIPVDETCPLTGYQIYIDADGIIYDASLNQTNASNNNNKFYRLQLLQKNGDYKTWTRWGRVGERGQSGVLGTGNLADAIHEFDSKFKSKTGLAWENRTANPKPNKYTFIERSYNEDSDDDKEEEPAKVKTEDQSEAPESQLAAPVQRLMELIFNQQYFAATMTDLNYDVNKLPLGKLSKNTITRGYQALKDLSALIDNAALAQTQYGTTFYVATEQLSNAFYSLIPHAFGRNRPPIIHDQDMLKKEVELLDSLSDMRDATIIMKNESKDTKKVHNLDRQFEGLNLDEMTPLGSKSKEFKELRDYLIETKGQTHNANYQVDQIFRIERKGEKDRFDKSPFSGPPRDRRLLWHGSRCTNFGGILSQGLRIAPPEAPVSGYMFGKGIYLADMSSKSANYCCPYISNGHALLLLCEAELGDPMQILTNASYTAGEDAKAQGMSSTWGRGMTGPSLWKDGECAHPSLKGIKMPDTSVKPGLNYVDNVSLMYNEYITYDVAQVRLRYLFQVRM